MLFQAQRRDVDDPGFRALATAVTYGLSAVALAPVCLHTRRAVRYPACCIVMLAGTLGLGWRAVSGTGFGLHEANLIVRELEFAPDALRFFIGRYLWGAAAGIAAAGLLFRASELLAPRVRPGWVLALPVLAFLACSKLYQVTVFKVFEFPAPYRIPILLSHAGNDPLPYYGAREIPTLTPRNAPAAKHLILIVDESVSGDLLGINGGPAATTPYLASLEDRVSNLGVISAISNFSSGTNIVLQSGLRLDQLPDRDARSLRNPSLFAYMARAGFRTFYLDGQTYSDPSNYLTDFDLAPLDGYVQVVRENVGVEGHEIDQAIASYLGQIVASNATSFSYVLKAGAHFEYELRYPESARVFRPTLDRGELMSLSFRGSDRERTLNSYLNALHWAVDGFWRSLLQQLEATGKDVLVLYTSDHGQSLLEVSPSTGRIEPLVHNTPRNPPAFQAMVPLFLVTAGDAPAKWLQTRFDRTLRDRLDQYAVFPTMLEAAGYDADEVRARYGPGIFDRGAASEPRRFLSGDLFGRAPFALNEYRPLPRPAPGS